MSPFLLHGSSSKLHVRFSAPFSESRVRLRVCHATTNRNVAEEQSRQKPETKTATVASVAEAAELSSVRSREASMEYTDLKNRILRNAAFSGSFFFVYLASSISLKAGLASAVGSVGSYIYLLLLVRDVDQLRNNDQVPIKRAEQMPEGWQRRVASVLAHYQQSLRPRMLVLVALAVFIRFSDGIVEGGLSTADRGSLLLGFLSYKIPLLLVLYDALKPKFDDSDIISANRPVLEEPEEDAVLFDLYGRRKPDIDQKLKDLKE